MKKNNIRYEDRYKHKLNMLEPGTAMLKIIGILILLGIIMWMIRWKIPAYIAFSLSGILFIILLILVAIELHQDKVLNEIAQRENAERKES